MKKSRWIALMAASAMFLVCHTPARSEENGGESTKNQEAAQVSKKPGQTKALKHVFTATHAGTWYPGDKKGLQALLTKFFDQARPKTTAKGRLMALISPHAGYTYSGPTAAFGYKLLKQRGQNVRLVVIMGPSHDLAFGGLALPDWDGFKTPLGTVGVATKIVEKLDKQPPFKIFDQAFAREHSVEMQVPMLQFALKNFQIVPIVVGSGVRPENLESLWLRADGFIVGSSLKKSGRATGTVEAARVKRLQRLRRQLARGGAKREIS